MPVNSPIRLSTEVQPGKPRNPYLDQQTRQIEEALNQALAKQSVRTVVQNTVVTIADWYIIVDATNQDVIVTLPLSSMGVRAVGVKRIDGSANAVTIVPSGGDTIDGAAFKTIAVQYNALAFAPDGVSAWYIVGAF